MIRRHWMFSFASLLFWNFFDELFVLLRKLDARQMLLTLGQFLGIGFGLEKFVKSQKFK
jgi:hypothetical protein